jgi:hypothetical protein
MVKISYGILTPGVFDVPWLVGGNTIGVGFDIPWIRGSIFHG